MPSINFNQSALVALDTLRNINMNLSKVQNIISTGKEVSSARDNAAIWSISKTMETDSSSFSAITDSLALGNSTLEVARSGAEQITALLQEMKTLIISANEENVDRTKIQADVDALKNQIDDIVAAAQFNGLNLLNGTQSAISVLSSLNRDTSGTVTTDSIAISAQDLTSTLLSGASTIVGDGAASQTAGDGSIGAAAVDTETFELALGTGATYAVGDVVELTYTVGGNTTTLSATAEAGDGVAEMIAKLESEFNGLASKPADVTFTFADGGGVGNGSVSIVSGGTSNAGISGIALSAETGATTNGGLASIAAIDLTSTSGASTALANVETALDTAIAASASLGSAQRRIDIQTDFVLSLIGSLDAGISSLTDANLEEASARLQSLQVQQQLNIQALTIANQSPQAILALFQ